MKKHNKIMQSPFTPLFILIVIMMGYIISGRHQKDSGIQETVVQEEQQIQEESDSEEEPIPTEEPLTNAQTAVKYGEHITETIEKKYATQVVEDYCNREVVACSSSGLKRENEEYRFCQTFDEMSGYMSLVKITSSEETQAEFQITTEIEEVTAVLVFPDMTYVCLDLNEKITCPLPKGNSTIIYIGKDIAGSIQVEIEENESLTCKRM